MKNMRFMPLVLSLGLAIFCGSMFAHHGTNASYDMDKIVTISGTVTEFIWSNPHCQVYLDVKDEQGNIVHWAGEMNSPGVLERAAMTRRTLKPGDVIKVNLHPSRAGAAVGVVQDITLPDGKVLTRGGGGGQQQQQ